jgi:hypothetical protein
MELLSEGGIRGEHKIASSLQQLLDYSLFHNNSIDDVTAIAIADKMLCAAKRIRNPYRPKAINPLKTS